jgi:plastocyanin
MSRTSARAGLALILALGPTLLLPASSQGETFKVRMAGSFPDFRYDPDVRRILKRDRINFKNPEDQVTHTVSAYGGNWNFDKTLSGGENVIKRFRRRGLFKYRCRFHAEIKSGECEGMCGRIRVRRPG